MDDFPFCQSESKAVPYASSWLHLNRRFVSLILSYYFYFRVYSCFSSIAFLTMMWVPVAFFLLISCWVFDLFDYDFDSEQDDDYNNYDVILGFDRESRE